MAENKSSKATAAKAAGKTPAATPAAAPAPAAAQQDRTLSRAATPTPAIAGVTVPAGVSNAAPVAPQQVIKPKPFMSEGMRQDLQDNGYAVDPVSGARFELNYETGEVTLSERLPAATPQVSAAGWTKPVPVEVAITAQPAANDTDRADEGATEAAQPERAARPSELDTGETLSYDPVTGVATAHDPHTGESREVSEEELQAAQAAQGTGD